MRWLSCPKRIDLLTFWFSNFGSIFSKGPKRLGPLFCFLVLWVLWVLGVLGVLWATELGLSQDATAS